MACVPEPVDILRCGPAEWSEILRRGARAWNAWRDDYPWIIPDLRGIAPSVIECQLGPLTGGPINLANARLRGALLGRATLSEANLEGADLTDVDLTNARLDRANLSYANLRNANLDKADLAGARLMRADLGGANLAHARNLVQGQLFGTIGEVNGIRLAHTIILLSGVFRLLIMIIKPKTMGIVIGSISDCASWGSSLITLPIAANREA